MLGSLIIPSESICQEYPLQLAHQYGAPALVARGHTLTGSYFRFLRDHCHARIETDEVDIVSKLLGLPEDEPGLCEETGIHLSRRA